jgi:DNA polymerase III epsilon subunit-like protein
LASAGNDEKELIKFFYDDVMFQTSQPYHGGNTYQDLIVIGHNIVGFDLPFLKHRSIIHGIKPPPLYKRLTWQ